MLFGPGADSGTFDYFTEAVNGKAKASRGDYTASEDDNVLVQGVENNKNALGYFGFAYYVGHKDKMRAVPIVNPKGKAVGPSIEAVNDGSYKPLSRPLFIYVRDTAAQRAEVKEFIQFYLSDGAKLVKEVGYVPLPPQAYKLALQHFTQRQARHGLRRRAGSRRDDRRAAGARRQALNSYECRAASGQPDSPCGWP